MESFSNGYMNGHRTLPTDPNLVPKRFSAIPSAIDIPVTGIEPDDAVEVDLEDLTDDPTELCTLLENERVPQKIWQTIALAYAKQGKADHAIEILTKGLESLSRGPSKEKITILILLCWLFLAKSREAPRVVPEGQVASEVRTKDYYLQEATGALNEASRISATNTQLFLARGVLSLLRASLQPPSKPLAPGTVDHSERVETLRQSLRHFADASKASAGRNMMALLGRARAEFSLGKYADALECYQKVLARMPQLQDPDPRIGIGCCLWQLGFRDEARESWERALELNPESKIVNNLLGLYYINDSSNYATADPAFGPIYKKAMTQYTQKAFKLDKEMPLACATFGSYFLLRKAWPTVENLARKAIEMTDVNAVASDGWYLLARKEHYQDDPDLAKANDYYGRSDAARGGGDKGFLPARFGVAQIQVLSGDKDGAKFRLEKIVQQSKSVEAMMLLGALHAEDVFANQVTGSKEDKATEAKKAIALLEAVRLAWKDSNNKLTPDYSVLVYLARLYEVHQPEKSLQCLLQVEEMSIKDLPNKGSPEDAESEEAFTIQLREQLSPQLLNNIGCFQYQPEKHDTARGFFQTALNACVKAGDKEEKIDTDALVTTISYNLARTYEAAGLLDEAKPVYEGLLARHNDYVDARTRLAYIALRQHPTDIGPKTMVSLYETDSTNLEVRCLYGWYLSRSKKRMVNMAEDPEQRHYKHTLQHYDKHDRYSLTGMGNLYLTTARESRRETEQDREKRRKTYEKAVEFYDKALQLDPRNAYAAQGIAIALVEDRKDFSAAVQIFTRIRDTVRDASVFINLGHVYAELRQFSKSIECYEAALGKDRAHDPQVLACLGRVWLLKGKQEKSPQAMQNSLDYSIRALAIAPSQIHFKFNIAFVQIQIAQFLHSLPESQRTLVEVQAAAEGLDAAIESFTQIAQSKNPPYPKHDIEQRANMGRNTMRHQLERAVQSQRRFEENNAAKLQEARSAREAEMRKRVEERRIAAKTAEEEKRQVAENRYRLQQVSRELAEQRAEAERRKEEAEYTEDEETGERVKRKKVKRGGKRRKKGDENESDVEAGEKSKKRRGKSTEDDGTVAEGSGEDVEAARPPKRRRKLARKGQSDNYKSTELVVESDSDGDGLGGENGVMTVEGGSIVNGRGRTNQDEDMDVDMDTKDDGQNDEDDEEEQEEEEEATAATPSTRHRSRRKPSRRIQDDDDEDEDEGEEEEEERNEEEKLGEDDENMDLDIDDTSASAAAPPPAASPPPNAPLAPDSDPESETETENRPRGNIFSDLSHPPVKETVAAAGAID